MVAIFAASLTLKDITFYVSPMRSHRPNTCPICKKAGLSFIYWKVFKVFSLILEVI